MATNPYASPGGPANLGIGGNHYGGSNPYLQQNIDRTMGDVSRQYNNTVAPQRAGAGASSGSFGNSGQQAMQLEDQRNFGQTLANTTSQMRMADYTQQQAMYQQDRQNDLQNRSLDQQSVLANRGMDIQSQGQDKNYQLGMSGLDAQRYGIDTGAASNRYGVDASERTAAINNQTNIRGQDKSYGLGMSGLDAQRYGIDTGAATTIRGQDKSFDMGQMQNNTQRYGIDSGSNTARYGVDAGERTAAINNATNIRGQDQNFTLGQGQLANSQTQTANQYTLGQGQNAINLQNANTSATNATNQYNLGLSQNAISLQNANTSATNAANQFALGQEQNAIGLKNATTNATGVKNQYDLGMSGLDAQRYGIDTSAATATRGQDINRDVQNQQNITANRGQDYQKMIAEMNDKTQNLGIGNSYDLGLRGNDLGYANLDSNIAQNNFGNQMSGARFGLDVQNSLQAGNNLGLGAANTIQNTPLTYQQEFNNYANATGGLGGQVTGTTPGAQGDPLTGAMGGYQLANGAYNQYNKRSSGDPALDRYLRGNLGSGD